MPLNFKHYILETAPKDIEKGAKSISKSVHASRLARQKEWLSKWMTSPRTSTTKAIL